MKIKKDKPGNLYSSSCHTLTKIRKLKIVHNYGISLMLWAFILSYFIIYKICLLHFYSLAFAFLYMGFYCKLPSILSENRKGKNSLINHDFKRSCRNSLQRPVCCSVGTLKGKKKMELPVSFLSLPTNSCLINVILSQ